MSRETNFDARDPKLVGLLRKVQALGRLRDEEIALLPAVLKLIAYDDNETVFSEGDYGTCAFIVADGEFALERWGHVIKRFARGDLFGEIALIDDRPRTGTVRAIGDARLYRLEGRDLENESLLSPSVSRRIFQGFARLLASYMREGSDLFRELDVLLVQDGGCAPGYNPVTAFITEYLEKAGRKVFVTAEGFKSLVANRTEDYRCLIHDAGLFGKMEHIPGVDAAQPMRDRRGADYRCERFPEFKERAVQDKAVRAILERRVRVLVGIGGNGTLAGTQALAKLLPPAVQSFFIPVTIDSDVFGTHCIGEYTGVEMGAEKIRCYLADARTHKRCYIIEMMGAQGGFHALHSCLGAGADLAVLPSTELDFRRLAEALAARSSAVIVVAEGYKAAERKSKGFKGSAADYFKDEILATGVKPRMRLICEPFSRDIRGATPNNSDITLSLRMARKLAEMVAAGESQKMPAVLAEREYSIPFDEIRTDNTVDPALAALANRLS